jgi:chromosome segregation ATPase
MGQLSWEQPGPVQPPAPLPAPRPRGRRALSVLVVLGLVGLAAGGVAVGWEQREAAAGWRDRALLLEQQRDDAIGRAEALSDQLGELANLVQLSVGDLATLEERLAELAGEKALAEDRATVTRDELRTLATTVESAVRQLNTCVDDLLTLQNDTVIAFNELSRGQRVDIAPLNDRLNATRERCDAARRAGASAVSLAQRLR